MKEKEKIRLITISIGIFMLSVPMDSLQLFGGISILRILAIIPIVLSFFYIKEFKINKSILFLSIFVFYIFVQIFYSINADATVSKFTMFFMYFILLFLCTSIKYNDREIKFLEKMFAYSTIVSCILVIFFGFFEEGRLTIRINPNITEDENQFCGYFIVGTVYFLKNILEKKRILISSMLVITFLFFALLTGSRGGILSILLAIVVYLLLYAKKDKKKIKKIFISLLVGIFLIILIGNLLNYLSPEIAQRFSVENVQETGGTGRTKIWERYLNLFNESPISRKIFGYGSGSVSTMYGKVAHNNWIELLVETGICGEILFFILIASFIRISYKKNNMYLFSVLIGYIGLTLSLSLFSYKPIWVVMILIILRNSKKDNIIINNENNENNEMQFYR